MKKPAHASPGEAGTRAVMTCVQSAREDADQLGADTPGLCGRVRAGKHGSGAFRNLRGAFLAHQFGPDRLPRFLAKVFAAQPPPRFLLKPNSLSRAHIPATAQALVQVLLVDPVLMGQLAALLW